MGQNVTMRLLGDFEVLVDGVRQKNPAIKSRKGVCLMEYLILQRGKAVPVRRLIRELWSGGGYDSPESALKTMISRFRALLNRISPGLGFCIVSTQGGYLWESGPQVRVDVLELFDLLEKCGSEIPDEEKIDLFRRINEIYRGDLYYPPETGNRIAQANSLHREYLRIMHAWIRLLKNQQDYQQICQVCADALKIDDKDEQLHIELMRANVKLNHAPEALREYQRVVRDKESIGIFDDRMRESSARIENEGREAGLNLDTIWRELHNQEAEQQGPFFCDYSTFKVIYHIQIRNLERLGSTMFLAVIMIGNPDDPATSVAKESAAAGLTEILRNNLRKGDIVTRFAPYTIAMLLPTVNYTTGGLVMDRIERLFYEEYPNKNRIVLHSRISPLGGYLEEKK